MQAINKIYLYIHSNIVKLYSNIPILYNLSSTPVHQV